MDAQGNQVSEEKAYLLVKAPRGSHQAAGWYLSTWENFKKYCGGTLPAEGFRYRLGGTLESNTNALAVWIEHGHREPPRVRRLR